MFGIQKKLLGFRMIRTCWQSFQRSDYAITIQCCRLKTCNAAATIGISSRGTATVYAASGGLASSVHVPSVSAFGAANGIIARKFTRFSQVYRRRDYDAEDEHAINKHFYNPLNKYLDQVDGSSESEKSLEDIAKEQKRKIQSAKRARAAREFNRGPEKRALSWDAIQQIHYLRDEDPDEWSVASLAESFNVSEEVIVKVLKSKFRPSAKTKLKQDLVAAENTGYVTGGAGGNHSQALVAPAAGNRSPTGSSEGKEKKHARTSTKASGYMKKTPSETGRDSSAVLKSNPLSSESQEQSRRGKRDERNRPSHDTQREESEEEMKHPEVEFTFGNIDFENVDSLMGQVKLKPQVFRKGRNFYNEHGEFLYRI